MGPDPSPLEITNSIGLYRNMQLDPPGKSWTPWKCWTVLLHRISESYGLMIVFFRKKAMITGIPLQNQLRTFKNEEKNNVRAFFSQSGLDPPSAKPDENFLDTRMDIRYRGGRETISLLKPSIVLPRSNYQSGA